MDEEGQKSESERREAAIASAPCLQPNFKPLGVSQAQLSKFQELHKRRLQLKERSKPKRKSKGRSGGPSRSQKKEDLHADACASVDQNETVEETGITDTSSLQQNNMPTQMAPKKLHKLHWGLDTKERWERKSNM